MGFGLLRLSTVHERDSQVQKSFKNHVQVKETIECPLITHLTLSPFHTGRIVKLLSSLPHCKIRGILSFQKTI